MRKQRRKTNKQIQNKTKMKKKTKERIGNYGKNEKKSRIGGITRKRFFLLKSFLFATKNIKW
jgi:hypothetical protein